MKRKLVIETKGNETQVVFTVRKGPTWFDRTEPFADRAEALRQGQHFFVSMTDVEAETLVRLDKP